MLPNWFWKFSSTFPALWKIISSKIQWGLSKLFQYMATCWPQMYRGEEKDTGSKFLSEKEVKLSTKLSVFLLKNQVFRINNNFSFSSFFFICSSTLSRGIPCLLLRIGTVMYPDRERQHHKFLGAICMQRTLATLSSGTSWSFKWFENVWKSSNMYFFYVKFPTTINEMKTWWKPACGSGRTTLGFVHRWRDTEFQPRARGRMLSPVGVLLASGLS